MAESGSRVKAKREKPAARAAGSAVFGWFFLLVNSRFVAPVDEQSTLRRLAYVVVDECHAYRGVFGSHVGHVLRRLRRICRRYGAEPVFVLASVSNWLLTARTSAV